MRRPCLGWQISSRQARQATRLRLCQVLQMRGFHHCQQWHLQVRHLQAKPALRAQEWAALVLARKAVLAMNARAFHLLARPAFQPAREIGQVAQARAKGGRGHLPRVARWNSRCRLFGCWQRKAPRCLAKGLRQMPALLFHGWLRRQTHKRLKTPQCLMHCRELLRCIGTMHSRLRQGGQAILCARSLCCQCLHQRLPSLRAAFRQSRKKCQWN